MRKYLAYYENEWPANIAELTAVENKPFVGYLKGGEVQFTVIPKPVTGPADNEIWYTSRDGNIVTRFMGMFDAGIISNEYNDGQGIIKFDGPVTMLGNSVFQGQTLTSITIPNSVTSIGQQAFDYCYSLTSVTIPTSVMEIGSSAFRGCSSLTSITIPNSVTSIESETFKECSSLSFIVIGNGVTTIEYDAFYKCSSLTSVTIPNSVTSIGASAFYNCSKLDSIIFEGTQEQWNTITKGRNWNNLVPPTYVQCSDGQVIF